MNDSDINDYEYDEEEFDYLNDEIPPYQYNEENHFPIINNNYRYNEFELTERIGNLVIDFLADIGDRIIFSGNLLLFILLIVISIIIWPIGIFFLICLFCRSIRRHYFGRNDYTTT